jgi:hypothetical protein
MSCRVCLEDESSGKFVSPCKCKGDLANIHEKCLIRWIEVSERTECEICNQPYQKREVLSFQPSKYAKGCCYCSLQQIRSSLFFLILSMFALLFTNPDDLLIMTSCTTITLFMASAITAYYKNVRIASESLLMHKLGYSIALWFILFINGLDERTKCFSTCYYTFNQTCAAKCPTHHLWSNALRNIGMNLLYDAVNLLIILVCRGVVIYPVYNKKMVFVDEESQLLLENEF